MAGSTLERWVKKDYQLLDLEALSERVAVVGSILAEATPQERNLFIAIANRGDWKLSLQAVSYSERFTSSSPEEPWINLGIDWLFPPDGATVPFGGWRTFVDGSRVLAAKFDDNTLLVMEELPENFLRNDALSFGSNYLVALVTLIILFSVFAVWAITLPLRRIASAAMTADLSTESAPFEERGSVEIVALARALNAMQARISGMVDARTRMLRGISHDVRTPLTRLRLRAERVSDSDVRGALLTDIDRIERLLKASLSFLRDNHQHEETQRGDLASVLQTVCDEFTDMGHEVHYDGPVHMITNFKPLAITRVMTNLCENAVKFGTIADVKLHTEDGWAVIDVTDNGPGIADFYRNKVLEPFFKIDAARGGADAGFGLGLSIVSEIVQAHQGKLELINCSSGGLIARVKLPL